MFARVAELPAEVSSGVATGQEMVRGNEFFKVTELYFKSGKN